MSLRNRFFSVALCAFVACGEPAKDEPKPHKPPAGGGSAPATPNAPPPPAKLDPAKSELMAEVRKRQLSNEDFLEGENNRDPFRSFLSTFAVQVQVSKQHKIILEKFSIEELKLQAIVAGEATSPRAMFVDPTGMGIAVLRGDHISKSDATVIRIAPDRVFLQMEEDLGGKPKMTERVLELHAGEPSTQ